MTETTVRTVERDAPKLAPFLCALIAAPLTICLPAVALTLLVTQVATPLAAISVILVVPIVATGIGAPTYLLMGGPAFWASIKRGYSIVPVAFAVNAVSLPLVALVYALLGGDPWRAFVLYALLGSVFAPLWGGIFSSLYMRFTGEEINV